MIRAMLALLCLSAVLFLALPLTAGAAPPTDAASEAWRPFAASSSAGDLRCAVPSHDVRAALGGWQEPPVRGVAGDCSASSTNPTGDYEPAGLQVIPVVVHVIMDSNCNQGQLSDAMVQSQIDILNEDFQAIAGSNGANGFDSLIQFELASVDPQGQPTTGITRDCNTTWFNDGGAYWNTLAWEPARYLNIYTNNAGGALGYVPFLPADNGGAFVGQANDRVVVLHTAFGRNSPAAPYDQGRTATHEVGHYLGLEHTFSGGCGSSACYTTGDLLCDTNAESSPAFGCPVGASSCGSPDPIDNYMDYSDDLCMERFTQEQVRRMICSLRNYRSELAQTAGPTIFTDGFESGNTSAWSSTVP